MVLAKCPALLKLNQQRCVGRIRMAAARECVLCSGGKKKREKDGEDTAMNRGVEAGLLLWLLPSPSQGRMSWLGILRGMTALCYVALPLRGRRRQGHLVHSLASLLGARGLLPTAALPGSVFGNPSSRSNAAASLRKSGSPCWRRRATLSLCC